MSRDTWAGFAVGIAPVVIALVVRYAPIRLIAVVAGGMLVLGSH
jgi:hypothetical protein